jgi:hydroxyethylthiazole kinase-like uncharacterized protein yjeF
VTGEPDQNLSGQILTVTQMLAAEMALVDAGGSIEALMQTAGRGAADWVWRVAGTHPVTVLCGPGNNGGDGYVIAEAIRERGGHVAVIAGKSPKTVAAQKAATLYRGEVLGPDAKRSGDVLVDCLFGSGLTRALEPADAQLLARLAASHRHRIAVDVPSGVQSDTGEILTDSLPQFDLTLALGAWKFAHVLMPAAARMGELRLVPIGIEAVAGAAQRLARPRLSAPPADAHKYTRGLLAVVGGAMPGAGILAATAAHRAGAGYVKLLGDAGADAHVLPPDLVTDTRPLDEALDDARIAAVLIGPGLGRDDAARARLAQALSLDGALVLDADALVLLESGQFDGRRAGMIATPHEGELKALEKAFGMPGIGSKPERARMLAEATRMVIVAKGPDTVIAAPDGRLACAQPASSWLSTAGTGDVLAGIIASRLATGAEPFTAASEGLWLHGEAARQSGPAFAAADLAAAVPSALGACL